MGLYTSDYEIKWRGKVVKLREHVGYGTSRDPINTIRVAFFFDEKAKKTVVGYMGYIGYTNKTEQRRTRAINVASRCEDTARTSARLGRCPPSESSKALVIFVRFSVVLSKLHRNCLPSMQRFVFAG